MYATNAIGAISVGIQLSWVTPSHTNAITKNTP